jgi:hypothetical protein
MSIDEDTGARTDGPMEIRKVRQRLVYIRERLKELRTEREVLLAEKDKLSELLNA